MRLTREIILKGKGLHSGADCELILEPSDAKEIFLNGVPIRELELSGTNRGSDYIFPNGERVKTCEHVFSALSGLGFWNGINIWVNGGEMPALDGCSKTLCDLLVENSQTCPTAGGAENFSPSCTRLHCQQGEGGQPQTDGGVLHTRPYGGGTATPEKISRPVIISSDDKKRFVAAFPSENLHITYSVEYKFIGAQIFDYTQSPENYLQEISRARTFAMKSDIDYLRAHGMALGGSLENAIVVGEEIQASGGLHWQNEFVRHKVLDLVGDLFAIGQPILAHVIAVRAGHELHLKLAQKLRGE